MKIPHPSGLALIALLLVMPPTQAVDLGGLTGGLDPGSLASGSAGNAAGIIGYCVKNNYLGKDAVGGMKDKLMGKLGVQAEEPEQDPGYQDGLLGLLKTGKGESVDLNQFAKLKKSFTRKACSAVLEHASNLL
jgi:hypothetical protein